MSPEPNESPGMAFALIGVQDALTTLAEGGSPRALENADKTVREFVEHIGYTATYDSRAVIDDPFDVMSHEEIWEKAQSLEPGTIDGTSSSWRMLGFNASMDAGAFALRIGREVGTNWQGAAADAAGRGVGRYANSAIELSLAADSLAHKVVQTQAGVTSTRNLLPPPVPYAGGEKFLDAASWVARTLLPGDIKSMQHVHEEAEELARSVMKTQYAPAIAQAAVQIPVLPPALDPLAGTATFTLPDRGSGAGSGGTPYGAETFRSSGTSGATGGSATTVAGQGPSATPQDTATQASSWMPENPGATGTGATGHGTTNPGTTSTSGSGAPGGGAMVPGSAGPAARGSGPDRSGSRSPLGTGGGSMGSGGTGGRGTGSGSGSGSGSLGATGGSGRGSSLPGAPGGVGSGGGSGALGTGSAVGRAGAPGMGGMGGMAPAAGRGGAGGEDDVHKTPGYLIDAVNGDELIGTLPLVAPPVLGE